MAMVEMDGQHSPWSLALSASEIKTDLGVGGIWSGQQALITAVDIVNPQREGGLSVAIPTAAALVALLGRQPAFPLETHNRTSIPVATPGGNSHGTILRRHWPRDNCH